MDVLPSGAPPARIFSGTLESDTVLSGTTSGLAGGSKSGRFDIVDYYHLRESVGALLVRATPEQSESFKELRRMSFMKLPATPFNLTGTWSFENGQQVSIRQTGEEVVMATGDRPVFRGRYASNPSFTGSALLPSNNPEDAKWIDATITVQNPDHILYGQRLLYRFSPPETRDAACDENNSNKVTDWYAWKRGERALEEKDYKTAKCWLEAGARWRYPKAQSLLAGLIIDGKDGTAPDYARAFDLANRSADQGDTIAAFTLSVMYKTGKGTPVNEEKAALWLTYGKNRKDMDTLLQAMTPEAFEHSFKIVSGMAGLMVDFDLTMTPKTCLRTDGGKVREVTCLGN